MKKFLLLFFVFTIFSALLSHIQCCHHDTYSVLDFGAAGDGSTDDTKAFEKAWKATCSSAAASPTMFVPYNHTFLLLPVVFDGPCKSNSVHVVIDGDLIAPSDPSKWKCSGKKCKQWIAFVELDGLYISGSGTINGQGKKWWNTYCKHHNKICKKKPTGFLIGNSNNVHIRDLRFVDSPQMHIALERSTWVYVSDLIITAPWNSPNTDGIHTQHSQNVFIDHLHIGTGDDCISLGDGSAHINITNIDCGPGHGISIGSLGIRGKKETVEYIYVSDVTFSATSNGVRIKTWQGGRGFARNITFERIRSDGSKRPIIIDQFYCDHQHCQKQTSAVQVSNVRYSEIYGTSKEQIAVEFACSESVPCKDIYMNDINLRTTQHGSETMSTCLNAQGWQSGEVLPTVPCLRN